MAIFSSRQSPLLGLVAVLFGFSGSCLAHQTGLSTSDLQITTNGVVAEVVLAGADLMIALAHFQTTNALDKNHDGTLTQEEFAGALQHLRHFAAAALIVDSDGQVLRSSLPKLTLDEKDNFHIELTYEGQRPAHLRLRAALFGHLPPDHLHFVSVHDVDGKTLGNKMLKPADDSFELSCPTGTATTQRKASTFTDFFKLGVEHIWTGYDHLLFLLALLLVCATFKSAVQVVTFFTVAHSITLAFATLNLVWVSSRVVEPAIAASIIYVGIENLTRPEGPKGRWLITFLFGLVHGFGFASVLRDMGVTAGTSGVAVPLIAFNLGVEAGQIVIAGILLPIIWQLRKRKPFLRWGVPGCSVAVAGAGGYWLVQRLFFS